MKVWKILAVVWVAAFMVLGDGALRAHASEAKLRPVQRLVLVRYETLQAPHSTTLEVVRTIRAAAIRFRVSQTTMRCIADRESNLDETAINHNGGPGDALGLFQHLRRYWPGRVRDYNRAVGEWLKIKPHASPFGMRPNSLVTAWMMHRHGLGPWGGGC